MAQEIAERLGHVQCETIADLAMAAAIIFEPHTDIIIKDMRDTEYGHKVYLTTGKVVSRNRRCGSNEGSRSASCSPPK
jgi:hypothetical protein